MKRIERNCILAALTIFTLVEAGSVLAFTHSPTNTCITDFCTSELRKRDDTTSYAALLCVSGARNEAELLSACNRILYKKSNPDINLNATSFEDLVGPIAAPSVAADVAHAHSAEHSSVKYASQPEDSTDQSSVIQSQVVSGEESLLQNGSANLEPETANTTERAPELETSAQDAPAETVSDVAEHVVNETIEVDVGEKLGENDGEVVDNGAKVTSEEPLYGSGTTQATTEAVFEDRNHSEEEIAVDNQSVSPKGTVKTSEIVSEADKKHSHEEEASTQQPSATTDEDSVPVSSLPQVAPVNDTASDGAQVVSQTPVESLNQSVQNASASQQTDSNRADTQASDEREVVQMKKLADGSAVHVHYHIYVKNPEEITEVVNKLTEQPVADSSPVVSQRDESNASKPITSDASTRGNKLADSTKDTSSDAGQFAFTESNKNVSTDANTNASKDADTTTGADVNANLQNEPVPSQAQTNVVKPELNEANDKTNVGKEAQDTIIGSSSGEQLELPQPQSTSAHQNSARSTPQPRSPSDIMFKSTRRLKTFSHMAHSHDHEHGDSHKHAHEVVHDHDHEHGDSHKHSHEVVHDHDHEHGDSHKHSHEVVHDHDHEHENSYLNSAKSTNSVIENPSTPSSAAVEQSVPTSATGNDSETLVATSSITNLPDPLENLVEPVGNVPLASKTSEVKLSQIAEEKYVTEPSAQTPLSDVHTDPHISSHEHDESKEKKFAPSAFDAYFDEPPREPGWIDTDQLAKLAESFVVQADTLQQRCGTLIIVLAAVCCVVLFERLVLPRAGELNKVAEKRRVLAETLKLELAKKELECATFLRLTSSARQRAAGHADAAQRCAALQNDNSKLLRDLETTKAAANKLRSDYEEMASRAKEVDAHAKALHDRSDLLLAERNELAAQIDVLQQRYDADTEDLRSKLTDIQAASQAFENALRELQSVQLVARAHSLSSTARKHSSRTKPSVTNGNDNNDWLDEAEVAWTADAENASEKHRDEVDETNVDGSENDELDGATPADVQRVFELLIDVNRARKECAAQRAELDNALERLNEANRAVTALNDQLAASAEERNTLTARYDELAAELAALERRSAEDYAANDASLRGQLAQVTERLAEVEERERIRVAELDAKAHDADSEAREMRRKAAELEHECARLRKMVAMQTGPKAPTHNRTADNSVSGKQRPPANRSAHPALTPTGSAVGCPPSEPDSSRLDGQGEPQAVDTRRPHADGVAHSIVSGNSSFSNGSAAPRNAVPFSLQPPPFNSTALPLPPFPPPADINSAMPRMPFPFPPGFDFTRLPSPFNLPPPGFQLPPFGAAPNLEGASRSPATQRRMRSEDERSELSRREAQEADPARRRDAKLTVHEEAGQPPAEAPEAHSNRTPQTARRKQQAVPASRKKE